MQTRCYQADFVCVTVRNESSVTGNPFPGIQPIGSSSPPPRSDALRSPWPGYTRKNVFTGRPFRFKWTRDGQGEKERERGRKSWRNCEANLIGFDSERRGEGRGFRFFCPLSSIRFLELILLVESHWLVMTD